RRTGHFGRGDDAVAWDRDEQTLTSRDCVIDADLAAGRIGDDCRLPVAGDGEPIRNAESAQGVDRAPRVRVDDDDDAVAVAADPHALSIRTGRDALDELRNRDDALRFALRHVEPADRSIDDVRREELIPGGGHRQHMRRTPVRRYGANYASIAE